LTKINPDKYIFDYFIAYLINKFRDKFVNADDILKPLKLLGIRKTELILDGENINYEPTNIKISRDIIENIKSQPELKDMVQEIENIYSSTLPKHEVKQQKAKL